MEWLNTILQGILLGGLYAMFAAGLSLIFGVMRLVNIAHGDLIVLAAYVALACWCFARHAEVLRISADDLKLDGKVPVVEIRPRKRGTVSYRAVTVPACVLELLREAKAEALAKGSAPVVTWGRVRWGAVREAAGLAERGEVKNKKRSVYSSVWQENILRHTGISYLFQQTGDMRDVTRQAGNSSDTAFRHYLNLPVEGAAEAFFSAFQGSK